MMEGEFESLLAIDRTRTLRVPHPHRVLPHPSGHGGVLVVEYLHFGGLRKHQTQLGQDLARCAVFASVGHMNLHSTCL